MKRLRNIIGTKRDRDARVKAYARIRKSLWRKHKQLTIVGYEYSSKRWFVSCACGSTSLMTMVRFRKNATCGCGVASVDNIIGNVYSRLTVVSRGITPTHLKYKRPHWICECECGNFTTVDGKSLKAGLTKSCGCLQGELYRGIGRGRAFTRAVRKACNGSCVICGSKVAPRCHHLASRNANPDLALDVNNGVVLCRDHHVEFHKLYGFGDNTLRQFIEYFESHS